MKKYNYYGVKIEMLVTEMWTTFFINNKVVVYYNHIQDEFEEPEKIVEVLENGIKLVDELKPHEAVELLGFDYIECINELVEKYNIKF